MFDSLSDRLSATLRKLTGRGVLRPEDIDATLREVRMALLEADVNYKVVKDFQERIRARLAGAELEKHLNPAQQVVKVVHDELVEMLGANTEGLHLAATPPTVVLLAGLQGSGKTTTAVKLALWARRQGRKPLVAALDLRRPAAVEQLRLLAEREKVDFHSGSGAVEGIAQAAVAEARRRGDDLVTLDTAGRLHVDQELLDELKRLKAAVPVTETLLVADAMTGQEAVNVGSAFADAVGLDGVILTKLDGDARGGAALSLRYATGQRVRFAGTGEKPADLEVFHADRMASRILGMGDVLSLIERAERAVDREEAQRVEKNLRAGTVSFDDFLVNIRQLKSMGSVAGVLEMMPGAGQLKGALAGSDPEAEVKRMEAIILSMTARERARPELIDGSRRKRIARGSGTQVSDVNKVLKAREAMQQLLRRFGGGGGRKANLAGLTRMLGR
ncbi:MAG TPA: signal recognition particle protein [Candidatus Dormibacteraeota bacterium]